MTSNPLKNAFASVDSILSAREIRDAMRADRPAHPPVMVYTLAGLDSPHSDSLELTTDDVVALAGIEAGVM